MLSAPSLSVIIPASNEAAWISACLQAVFAGRPVPGGCEVIVVANGCQDDTAQRARAQIVPEGFSLQVIERAEGSKPQALNAGDRAARGHLRAYLDADCRLSPSVLADLVQSLSARPTPAFVAATPQIPRARSWVTRRYAGFWALLPFNRSIAQGYGLYAVNQAGRARWAEFPAIIADDSFVRLQFQPSERAQIAAAYDWPLPEGFAALVKVRQRQNRGMRELAQLSPALLTREAKPRLSLPGLGRLILQRPLGFLVYAAVILAVRLRPAQVGFTRGR